MGECQGDRSFDRCWSLKRALSGFLVHYVTSSSSPVVTSVARITTRAGCYQIRPSCHARGWTPMCSHIHLESLTVRTLLLTRPALA